jgi:hypothetical protein
MKLKIVKKSTSVGYAAFRIGIRGVSERGFCFLEIIKKSNANSIKCCTVNYAHSYGESDFSIIKIKNNIQVI